MPGGMDLPLTPAIESVNHVTRTKRCNYRHTNLSASFHALITGKSADYIQASETDQIISNVIGTLLL